ncbi:MAG: hypothetical protein ACJ8D0_15650 [Xanthobacteraceae bacterium]
MSANASRGPLPAGPADEPALAEMARRFPEDLKVAAATAQILRSGPRTPPEPRQDPWPPMRVPK